MYQFKDFRIKNESNGFEGDKIKIERILNREITVHEHRIEQSKFKGRCLWLQISIGQQKHVVFTGSENLMQQIAQVPDDGYPFNTTIIKDNERYKFT